MTLDNSRSLGIDEVCAEKCATFLPNRRVVVDRRRNSSVNPCTSALAFSCGRQRCSVQPALRSVTPSEIPLYPCIGDPREDLCNRSASAPSSLAGLIFPALRITRVRQFIFRANPAKPPSPSADEFSQCSPWSNFSAWIEGAALVARSILGRTSIDYRTA